MNNKTAELDEKLRSVTTEIKALESSRPALEDALLMSLKGDIAEVFLTAFGVDFSETKTITTTKGKTRSVRRSFNEKKESLEAFLKRLDEPSVQDALAQFVASTDASEESSKKQDECSDEASEEASEKQDECSDEASEEASEKQDECSDEASEEALEKQDECSDEASKEASEKQDECSDEASKEASESTPEEPQSDHHWGSDEGNDQDGSYVPPAYY